MSATSPEQSPIVVDANLAVRAILPMQSGSGVLERFTDWREQGRRLVAPMLWLAEVVSAIRRIAHLGMISAEEGLAAIDDLFALEVEVIALDAPLCRAAFEWAGRLGQSGAYDGFYLALAEQLQAELWTADERLANSARQAGVSWVHGSEGSAGSMPSDSLQPAASPQKVSAPRSAAGAPRGGLAGHDG